jgi:hypothetical protein
VDLLVSTLRWIKCILGMKFIINNNVFIEGHNRLIKIPLKIGIIWVKAHEVLSVDGSTTHLMLCKTWKNECMGVATLTLGSQPKQRHGKVRAKSAT